MAWGSCLGGEHSQRRLAPLQRGAELGNAEVEGEHPERKPGVVRTVRAAQGFQLQQSREHVAVFFLEFADVRDGNAGSSLHAKEQLEQEFVTGRVVTVGDGEPLLQGASPGGGNGVFLALGPGLRGDLPGTIRPPVARRLRVG